MGERTRFVGVDVHAKTLAVAIAEEVGQPESYGQIANEPTAVRKLVSRLGGRGVRLVVAYEAGATGFALHRQLAALGVECMVVAPSLIPSRPGDRIKTDRRDALKLCRLLRSGDLTPVWVPDEEHEALRDLVRSRGDAKQDEVRAKHRLSKLLLRRGITPPVGTRAWTQAYFLWLDRLHCDLPADQIVLEDYREQVRLARARVARLDKALIRCADGGRHAPLLAALQAFRGFGFLTAVTIVAEAGDLRRFATARREATNATRSDPSQVRRCPRHGRTCPGGDGDAGDEQWSDTGDDDHPDIRGSAEPLPHDSETSPSCLSLEARIEVAG